MSREPGSHSLPKSVPNKKIDIGAVISVPLCVLPGGSAGYESACSVGDLGLIPGLGRSPGEGKS